MANQIMRITLKAYDHKLIDKAAAKRLLKQLRRLVLR